MKIIPRKNVLIFFVSSCIVGAVAMIVSVFLMGGGHGTYLPAVIFFPYAMGIAGISGYIGVIPRILAIVQFPVYGLVFPIAHDKNKNGPQVGLIALHLVSIFIAISAGQGQFI